MDIQKFINKNSVTNAQTTLTQLFMDFFSEKHRQVLPSNRQAVESYNTIPYSLHEFIADIEVIIDTGEKLGISEKRVGQWRHLILPNVAFQRFGEGGYQHITIYGENTWLGAPSVNYLKEVNEQMPYWKAEFKALCERYQTELQKIEHDRLMHIAQYRPHSFVSTYLQDKVDDQLLLERRTPDYAERLLRCIMAAAGKTFDWKKRDYSVEYKLPNMRVMVQKGGPWFFPQATISYKGNTLKFRERDISLEMLQELDHQLSIWDEEARNMLFDLQKKEKAEQLGRNVMRALVKQKMRELKMEYQLEEEGPKGNLVLTLKLEKRRMVKVTLRPGKVDLMKRQLDTLAEVVSALNAVPMDYRIYFQSNNTVWQREEEE